MPGAVTNIAFAVLLSSVAMFGPVKACEQKPPPSGAIALGTTHAAFDICPSVSEISADGEPGTAAFYRGVWWEKTVPDQSVFSNNADGSLSIPYPAGLATVPRKMIPGSLPLLAGDQAFFIEFEVSLSDDNPDHFPAVWLLPIEHNQRQEDRYPPDEPGFERWLELDVDEGGFTPGPMGTAISWSGVWPNYKRLRSNPNLHNEKIDRAQRHRFGAGFDPKHLTISFWYDDKLQYTASGQSVPDIARKQHFYLIMNAASQGRHLPYNMNVYRIRTFVR
jgi:hypothetical protein